MTKTELTNLIDALNAVSNNGQFELEVEGIDFSITADTSMRTVDLCRLLDSIQVCAVFRLEFDNERYRNYIKGFFM